MVVSKDGIDVLTAKRKNSLYYLEEKSIVGSLNIVEKVGYERWHKRLGHIGETGLKELVRKGIIQVDVPSNSSVCEHCILGKSKKLPFEAGIH